MIVTGWRVIFTSYQIILITNKDKKVAASYESEPKFSVNNGLI